MLFKSFILYYFIKINIIFYIDLNYLSRVIKDLIKIIIIINYNRSNKYF